jgi:enoyl-CoA hydratase
MTMTELVHLSVEDAVATITLDSPANRNALSRQLVSELTAHLETADIDPEVRVIRLRSAHRVFCAGADLSEASKGQSGATAALVAMLRRIVAADTPVVVELAGPVVAGGLGIVGAADIVIAADDVTMQLTEVRLGLAPAVISLTLLPRLTSRAASDLFLSGRRITAAEAAAAGFVSRVVAPEDVTAEVDTVVVDLVRGTSQGLRETKRLLNRDLLAHIDARGGEMAELSERLFNSDEAKAAMKAFLNR